MKKIDKKKTIIPIITGLLLAILVIGISYAYYNYQFIGNKSTLETADMSLEFIESNTNIINIENALPMGCWDGKNQAETFDFAVTSKTTKDTSINYNIYIEKLEIDNDATALNDSDIALYLTDYSEENELLPSNYLCSKTETENAQAEFYPVDMYKNIKPSLLASAVPYNNDRVSLISQLNNYKLYSGTHIHDNAHQTVQDKFKLRVWIAPDNVNAFNYNSSTKYQYKFRLRLTSEEDTTRHVYAYNKNRTLTHANINAGTYNGYCIFAEIESHQINSCQLESPSIPFGFITQEECQEVLNNEIHYSNNEQYQCIPGTWTSQGIGTYVHDYKDLNKLFFIKYYLTSNDTIKDSELCYTLSNKDYCLKSEISYNVENDTVTDIKYDENKNILIESFGSLNCRSIYISSNTGYTCALNDFEITITSRGEYDASNSDGRCYKDLSYTGCTDYND